MSGTPPVVSAIAHQAQPSPAPLPPRCRRSGLPPLAFKISVRLEAELQAKLDIDTSELSIYCVGEPKRAEVRGAPSPASLLPLAC